MGGLIAAQRKRDTLKTPDQLSAWTNPMRRRDFITLVGGGAAAWPFAARAQQLDRIRLIGMLIGYAESDSQVQAQIAAFRDELQKLG
jgi:hypothetical protein